VWRHAVRGAPRASLPVKLVAVALCLLAAGATVILTVGASTLRGELTRQAGAQLRAYAGQLTSHPFQVLGTARGAPGATAPFDAVGARSPGAARLSGAARAAAAGAARAATAGADRMAGETGAVSAASSPGTVVAGIDGIGAFSIELRGPSRQLLLSVGPGTQPGRAIPAPFAPVPARTGVLQTVQASGGDYLVIAEPVHVSARRLAFGYGADDFSVTSGPQAGPAGTLVVGLRLAGIGQTVRRLTLLTVAVSAAAIVIAGVLGWAAIRFSLRPVTQAARTADAVAASDHSSGMPEWPDGGLAGSLHRTQRELHTRFAASAEADAAARSATDQMSRDVAAVAESLRRPISLLHGVAEHWAHHDQRGAAAADRALDQVATEAAHAETLLDQLDSGRSDPAVTQDRG